MPAKLSALIVAFSLLAANFAFAETFNLSPIADAFVSSANPTNNYGGAGALSASAPGLAKGEFQSLLKFDFAGAKASFDGTFGSGNWILTDVSLLLTATSPGNPIFNTSAAGTIAVSWMENDSWIEGTGNPNMPGATGITFSSLPAFLSASDESLQSMNFSGATSGATNYSFGVSAGLQGDAQAGSLASLRLSAGDLAVSGLFNSRNFGTASARPVLTLMAIEIPEPASCVLCGFGMMIVIGRRFASRAQPN